MNRLQQLTEAVNELRERNGQDPLPPYSNKPLRWWFGVALILAVLGIIAMATQLAIGQQIMPQPTVDAVRAALPILEDEEANDKLHDPALVFYTQKEMPSAYQMRNARGLGRTTVHDPYYNISGDPSDAGKPLHGNWNHHFPWTVGKPGGGHNSRSISTVKAFKLPKPVAVFERTVRGDPDLNSRDIIQDWVFPEGTYFAEVLFYRVNNEDVCFEVRTRQKQGDQWAVDMFRSFATADALAQAIEELGPGKYRSEAIASLRSFTGLARDRLVDAIHNRQRAFDVTTTVAKLPTLATDDVLKLMDKPYTSVLGEKFLADASGPVNETGAANIVPTDYFGAHVNATGTSNDCMLCHESAGRHGSLFENRGAYGHIVGSYSDKILSWHPFALSSISGNGSRIPVNLRQSFINAGWIMRVTDRLPAGYKFTKVD